MKELEALERLAMPDELHIEECKKAGVGLTEDFDTIEKALLELKSIKEGKPSKTLKCLQVVENNIDYLISDIVIEEDEEDEVSDCLMIIKDQLPTIKQALQRLNRYEQILSNGRLTDRNYKNTTLDLDSCKPYLRLGQLEDIYEEGK